MTAMERLLSKTDYHSQEDVTQDLLEVKAEMEQLRIDYNDAVDCVAESHELIKAKDEQIKSLKKKINKTKEFCTWQIGLHKKHNGGDSMKVAYEYVLKELDK